LAATTRRRGISATSFARINCRIRPLLPEIHGDSLNHQIGDPVQVFFPFSKGIKAPVLHQILIFFGKTFLTPQNDCSRPPAPGVRLPVPFALPIFFHARQGANLEGRALSRASL
jgi:hypothetical protein